MLLKKEWKEILILSSSTCINTHCYTRAHTHTATALTLQNPQSQRVCRTPSHIIPRDNASSKCSHPNLLTLPPPPLISTLPHALSSLLLSTCYPPLCLSPSSSVLLIPSEKKRQSRKSPLHLCHTLPRSLLSLAPVSCWPPSNISSTTATTHGLSHILHSSSPFLLLSVCLSLSSYAFVRHVPTPSFLLLLRNCLISWLVIDQTHHNEPSQTHLVKGRQN